MVDFESLRVNGFVIEDLFVTQGWKRYFKMLNGPIYSRMVKEFWMKAEVFDELSARMQEEELVRNDPTMKGKTREEMG
ncbi:LRR receptor-like serine/threonine-protein kinase RCH1, partial [Trifolium medium]|nr:LRR receptor-like serine/threonine-protein kinase RCH1 [Trifolium medium]